MPVAPAYNRDDTCTGGPGRCTDAGSGLRRLRKNVKALLADESGATAIEYAIIAGGMRGIPVFLQKWWLNTVGNAVSVQEAQSFEVGEVIGSLSYIEHFNKAGILFGGNLPWTTLGGANPCSEFE